MVCPICGRPLTGNFIQFHHLVPKTFNKKSEGITIHKVCHQRLHSAITEREMKNYYHTVERLLEHPDIITFIKWVKNKPVDYYDKSDETKERHKKRRK